MNRELSRFCSYCHDEVWSGHKICDDCSTVMHDDCARLIGQCAFCQPLSDVGCPSHCVRSSFGYECYATGNHPVIVFIQSCWFCDQRLTSQDLKRCMRCHQTGHDSCPKTLSFIEGYCHSCAREVIDLKVVGERVFLHVALSAVSFVLFVMSLLCALSFL